MSTNDVSSNVAPAKVEMDDSSAYWSAYWKDACSDLAQTARARIREHKGLTELDTTGLVSETYARITRIHGFVFDLPMFLRDYSPTMRSIVIGLVHEKVAANQTPDAGTFRINTSVFNGLNIYNADPLRVHEALNDLAEIEPRLAKVMEMRYFCGYSEQEVADALGLSVRTVQRNWKTVCSLLRAMLTEQ